MFKPLNIPFFQFTQTKDDVTNRVQLQLKDTIDEIIRIQEGMFLLERRLFSNNENVKDTVIFQNADTPYVSSNPSILQPPIYPIGIGREFSGRVVIISTVLHYSEIIEAGKPYGLNASYLLTPITNRKEAVVIGVAPGIGIIIHQNLPDVSVTQ